MISVILSLICSITQGPGNLILAVSAFIAMLIIARLPEALKK